MIVASQLAALNDAIAKGEPTSSDRSASAQLRSIAESLDKEAAKSKIAADAERMRALAGILKQK